MKKIIAVILALLMVLSLCACYNSYEKADINPTNTYAPEYFTTVKSWGSPEYGWYRIVYANDTKVMYFINESGYKGGITPLYNADGSLQIYDEKKSDIDTSTNSEVQDDA